MIDHFNLAASVKEGADPNGFHQGPLCGGQRDIMRRSTLPEINLGPGYYTYCDLKRYGKLSNASSLLRDIKDPGLKICVFYTTKKFERKEIMWNLLYMHTSYCRRIR